MINVTYVALSGGFRHAARRCTDLSKFTIALCRRALLVGFLCRRTPYTRFCTGAEKIKQTYVQGHQVPSLHDSWMRLNRTYASELYRMCFPERCHIHNQWGDMREGEWCCFPDLIA